MPRNVRLCELLLGVEGLALLRHLYDGEEAAAERRLGEVRRVLDEEQLLAAEPVYETTALDGYEAWAQSYDEPGNPIIALEQPVVWSLLEQLAAGRALDAACGTGRHARRLLALGHEVHGFDAAPAMLARAAANAPQAQLAEGDLCAIPMPDAHFDVVVCGLALAHLPELHGAAQELARVLRPGGTLVVSVLHPLLAHLGWQAPFADGDGRRSFVREHTHGHGDYFAAFTGAQLDVRECVEPVLAREHVTAKRRVSRHVPEAAVAAYAGLPAVLAWRAQKREAGGSRG
jgi:SAM-dependent methyltransferase